MSFFTLLKRLTIFRKYKKNKLLKSGSLYGKHTYFAFYILTTLLSSTKKNNSHQLPYYSFKKWQNALVIHTYHVDRNF